MKTSQQWWAEVKADPAKFNDWLVKQYRGEITASQRIDRIGQEFLDLSPESAIAFFTLDQIAQDEMQHAKWLGLLQDRGIEPKIEHAEDRYWSAVENGATSFENACAVAAHAEAMRLERIRVIASDEEADGDVRAVFKQILRDEVFHEAAFRNLAGQLAMSETKADHEAGRRLLGLVA